MTLEQLTLFPPDTLANLLVMPGSDEARKMTATSGRKLLAYYKKSGPVGLLAKMLLDTSVWGSTTCYLTWKASATPHKRLLFRLLPSALATDEIGSSLWPTPTASETTAREGIELTETGRRKTKNGNSYSVDLATTVKLWPTPVAQDAKNATMPSSQINRNSVPGAVMREGHTAQEGQLNHEWVEMLMNFPRGWTDME